MSLIVSKSRDYRDHLLERSAQLLLRTGMSANMMTWLSCLFGIMSINFLFRDQLWFALLIFLHLLADAFDGVMARLSEPTNFGKYFDYGTDELIAFLILIKIALQLQDYYVYIIIAICFLTQAVYLLSKFSYPVLFFRTAIAIIMCFNFYPFTFLPIPIIAYLTAGVISLYSLSMQFTYVLRTRFH